MAKRGTFTTAYFEGKTINTAKVTSIPLGKNTKEAPTRKELKASLERIKKRDRDKWQS